MQVICILLKVVDSLLYLHVDKFSDRFGITILKTFVVASSRVESYIRLLKKGDFLGGTKKEFSHALFLVDF